MRREWDAGILQGVADNIRRSGVPSSRYHRFASCLSAAGGWLPVVPSAKAAANGARTCHDPSQPSRETSSATPCKIPASHSWRPSTTTRCWKSSRESYPCCLYRSDRVQWCPVVKDTFRCSYVQHDIGKCTLVDVPFRLLGSVFSRYSTLTCSGRATTLDILAILTNYCIALSVVIRSPIQRKVVYPVGE